MKLAGCGHSSTIHDLIVNMSDVNFIIDGALGWTPFHIAAKNNRERVVFHLLAAGADSKVTDRCNRIPRNLATSPAVRRLLENNDWLDTL
jgi:ankyrin repeat protein